MGKMTRILLADDEENFRELLGMILTAKGYEYRAVADGDEALFVLQEESFDIFLCDLIMGEMSGIEAMVRARVVRPDLKIIAVSGSTQYERQANSHLPVGADAIVPKPFIIEELIGMIERMLKQS